MEGALVAEAAVVQAIVASLVSGGVVQPGGGVCGGGVCGGGGGGGDPGQVGLSESEPYGVRGGTLVVLFNPAPRTTNPPVKVCSLG